LQFKAVLCLQFIAYRNFFSGHYTFFEIAADVLHLFRNRWIRCINCQLRTYSDYIQRPTVSYSLVLFFLSSHDCDYDSRRNLSIRQTNTVPHAIPTALHCCCSHSTATQRLLPAGCFRPWQAGCCSLQHAASEGYCNEIPPRDKNDEFTMRLCDYGPTVVGLQELLYYNDHTYIDLLMHVHGLIKNFLSC